MAGESRSVTDTASLLVSKGLNVLINYSQGFKPGEFSESRGVVCKRDTFLFTKQSSPDLRLRMDAPMPPKRNGCSRLFHCIMAVVYLVVLLTAVISLGTFATKQNEIASTALLGPSCVLFSSYSGKIDQNNQLPIIKFGQDAACVFSIWAEAALACASVGMFIFAVVLAAIGTQA